MNAERNERRSGNDRRAPLSAEAFAARIRATLAEPEPRKDWRAPIGQLVKAVQVAAAHGFPLQVVAAGSLHATFALTVEEACTLRNADVQIMLDT